ncbi:hypothetical protein ACVWYH_005562 [Bradyrhizobium sp. GM24.11]
MGCSRNTLLSSWIKDGADRTIVTRMGHARAGRKRIPPRRTRSAILTLWIAVMQLSTYQFKRGQRLKSRPHSSRDRRSTFGSPRTSSISIMRTSGRPALPTRIQRDHLKTISVEVRSHLTCEQRHGRSHTPLPHPFGERLHLSQFLGAESKRRPLRSLPAKESARSFRSRSVLGDIIAPQSRTSLISGSSIQKFCARWGRCADFHETMPQLMVGKPRDAPLSFLTSALDNKA